MKHSSLINRWIVEPKWTTKLETIIRFLHNGENVGLEMLDLELTENRIDLRGVDLISKKIYKTQFRNVDFSFSKFNSSRVEDSFFEKCYFEKVDFSNFVDSGNVYEECCFKNCKFNRAIIGGSGTKFTNCCFENCKFISSGFIRPEFLNVNFTGGNISNVDFFGSYFENCCFEGKLSSVWFRGGFPLESNNLRFGVPRKNEMKNVSFEKANFNNLQFSNNCDLSTVKIKNSDIYRKYNKWERRLLYLYDVSRNWDFNERKEVDAFIRVFLKEAAKQDWYILNREDLEKSYEKKNALKIFEHLDNFLR